MLRCARTLLAGLLATVALAAPASAGAAEGDISFLRNATSSFDNTLKTAGPTEIAWMQKHYDRFRAYPPFFDQFLSWAPPTDFYIDAYAVYDRDTEEGFPGRQMMTAHPDWILRDGAGNPLYIPAGCGGGTCPQYAADFGNPAYQAYFIGVVRQQLAKGYTGAHVDDINLEMTISDGNGNPVRPIDPRTGAPMTDLAWSAYMADFATKLRVALPDADITHNAPWFVPHSDPSMIQISSAADIVEMERGFNDLGIGEGSGRFGFETYLQHVDWLHAQGASVVYQPYDLSAKSASFEVASYLLAKEDGDMITSDYHSTPTDWWSGWNVSIGAAQGARYEWEGLIRRDFADGIVLVNQPDAPAATVAVDGTWIDLEGNQRSGQISLAPREGIVLQGAGSVAGGEGPPVGGSEYGDRLTLQAKRSVKEGRRFKVTGAGATAGAKVKVQTKTKRGWRTIVKPAASGSGNFKAKLHASDRGSLRLRAVAAGEQSSKVAKVKVV